MSPRLAEAGTVVFIDDAGVVQLSMPTAYLEDSSGVAGAREPALSVMTTTVTQDGSGWLVTYAADLAWLADPARVFPVVVDPAVDAVANVSIIAVKSDGTQIQDGVVRVGNTREGNTDRYWRTYMRPHWEAFFGRQVLDAEIFFGIDGGTSALATNGALNHATGLTYSDSNIGLGLDDFSMTDSVTMGADDTRLRDLAAAWIRDSIGGGYLAIRLGETPGQYTYRRGTATLYLTTNNYVNPGEPANTAPGDGWTGQLSSTLLSTSAWDPNGDTFLRRFVVGTDRNDVFGTAVWRGPWTNAISSTVPEGILAGGTTYSWYTEVYEPAYEGIAGISTVRRSPSWSYTTQNKPPTPPEASAVPVDNAVIATTTPTLSSGSVAATDADGETVRYWIRVATGPDARTGVVVNSGLINSPTWTVPAGSLQDGGAYTWTVLTWDGREFSQSSWTRRLRVDLRLGGSGPSPMDGAGPVGVNLANGNASLSFGSPTVATVAGPMGATFSYNSQRARTAGLTGRYYDYSSMTADPFAPPFNPTQEPVLTRVDPVMTFDWGLGSPGPAVPVDRFAVQWSGFVTPPGAGWTLGLRHDDGVRLLLNNTVAVDSWSGQAAGDVHWSSTPLTAGQATRIRVDYFEYVAPASVQLYARDSAGTVIEVPGSWLSTTQDILPPGWTANLALGGGGSEYTSVQVNENAVIVTDSEGSASTYTKTSTDANAGYAPPAGEYGTLSVSGDRSQVTLLDEDGTTYVFGANGRVVSSTSAADDRKAASHQYTYSASGLLTATTDPLSGRAVTFDYGAGDNTGACAGQNAPAGMLCRIAYPDTTVTRLTYDNPGGRLVRIDDPGGEVTTFVYDTSSRLTQIRDPLANDWLAADNTRPFNANSTTTIAYDSASRVSAVTLPAPDGISSSTRPGRTYGYNTTTRTSTVTVSGLTGVNRTVTYDTALRALTDTDATSVTSSQVWNAKDQVLRGLDGAGRVSTTVYDASDRVTDTYGPAAASCFSSDTTVTVPTSCANQVPRTSTAYRSYDPFGTGTVQAQFFTNRDLSGGPAVTRLGLTDATGDIRNVWGTGGPFPDSPGKVDDWSARLTGYVELPVPGNVQFRLANTDDAARVWLDDRLILDAWIGPNLAFGPVAVANPDTDGNGVPDRVLRKLRVEYSEHSGPASLELQVFFPGDQWRTVSADLLFDGLDTLVTSSTVHENPTQTAAPAVTTGSVYQVGAERSEVHGQPLATVVDPGGLNLSTSSRFDSYRRQTVRALPNGNADAAGQRVAFEFWGAGGVTTPVQNGVVCGVPTTTEQGGAVRYTIGATNSGNKQVVSEAVYDGMGRVAGTRRGVRDATSLAITWDSGTVWACTTYDGRGRPTQVVQPAYASQPARTVTSNYAVGGSPLVSSVTDVVGTVTSTVDLLGRVTRYVDVNGYTTVTTYDRAGRVTSSASTTSGAATPVTTTMAWTYDNAGRVLTVAKDALILASVTYSSAATGKEVTGVSYPTGAGNAGNGTSLGITRDARGQLASLAWAFPASQPSVTDAVTRSLSGRVLTNTVTDGATSKVSSYTYDTAGRLTGAVLPNHTVSYGSTPHTGTDPCAGVVGYVPGAGSNGNRMRVSDTLAGTSPAKVTASCYDGADRVIKTVTSGAWPGSTTTSGSNLSLGSSLAYDGRGNTTTLGDTTLVYDGGDRLVSMTSTGTNATSVTYTRDVLDRVVRRVETTGGVTTTTRYGYTASGDTADAVLTDAKALTEQVIGLPGGVVCTDRSGTSNDVWAYPNIHGDVIVTTNAVGTRQGGVSFYDPYGQPLDPATGRTGTTTADDAGPDTLTGNLDNGWLGQHHRLFEHAGGLAIIDMGARAYSPVLGRFLEIDPVLGGVDNDYTYVRSYSGTC